MMISVKHDKIDIHIRSISYIQVTVFWNISTISQLKKVNIKHIDDISSQVPYPHLTNYSLWMYTMLKYMCHVFFKGRLHIRVCWFVENIALHKPAQEAVPYIHPNVSASNAVDGRKTNLRGLEGQCSLSAGNKQTATWWVNLTSILSIHHITIYYRTDNVAWGN